jgi:hypothetical protein
MTSRLTFRTLVRLLVWMFCEWSMNLRPRL